MAVQVPATRDGPTPGRGLIAARVGDGAIWPHPPGWQGRGRRRGPRRISPSCPRSRPPERSWRRGSTTTPRKCRPRRPGRQRSQHEHGEPHPEDPGHEPRHRRRAQEAVPAEEVIPPEQQVLARAFEPPGTLQQPASLPDTERIPDGRTEHPGHHGYHEHGPYVHRPSPASVPAASSEASPAPGTAGSHGHDQHEHDDVFRQPHDPSPLAPSKGAFPNRALETCVHYTQ